MPEIYEMFFGLGELLRLFPKESKEFVQELTKYEQKLEEDMEINRAKLFGV